jgi:hypothetical protein
MGLFDKLRQLFSTRSGRDEHSLLKAIERAKSGEPAEALAMYNELLKGDLSNSVRCSALFNRALAHSSLKNDDQALADLKELLALPGVPENVQTAARSQLARVQKRSDRHSAQG